MPSIRQQYAVHEREIPFAKVKRAEGWREMNIKWLLGEATVGLKTACMFKAVIKAGAAHENHLHRKADELVYIISGKGRHGLGDEAWDIGPGDAYLNPKDMPHWSYGTDPNDPIVLVGVYVGAGSIEDTGYEYIGTVEG